MQPSRVHAIRHGSGDLQLPVVRQETGQRARLEVLRQSRLPDLPRYRQHRVSREEGGDRRTDVNTERCPYCGSDARETGDGSYKCDGCGNRFNSELDDGKDATLSFPPGMEHFADVGTAEQFECPGMP